MGRTSPRLGRRRFLQLGSSLVGLGLLGGCRLAPPWAQPTAKVNRIGLLSPDSREGAASTVDALFAALADLGYVEGQNLAVEGRFGVGEAELPAAVAELVRAGVDVLVTFGTPTARAAKAATSTIPIVVVSSDPVGAGLVESLARPGGNVTGLTNYVPDLAGKKLQLLRDTAPGTGPIAFLTNPNNPTHAAQEKELAAAAGPLGIRLLRLEAPDPAALGSAFAAAADGRAEAIFVQSDILVLQTQRGPIAQLAIQHRLPTMVTDRRDVVAGGLMSYGLSLADQERSRAAYIDKILRGARPAELPIEGPKRFDLVLNLRTAQAIGLTVPQRVLGMATEVIQ